MSDAELERIRAEYRQRDAGGPGPYRWDNPGYVSYMQLLERRLLNAFMDARMPLTGARVLDIGCGSGYFLHRLQEYGAGECHGVDLLENRVEEGRRRYPTLSLHVGSATELPFDDGEFDLVTQFTCLSSIVDADMRSRVAGEMRRVGHGWLMSFDMRRASRPRRASAGTPTVAIDEAELRQLFGEPALLRRTALAFDLAQYAGRHAIMAMALETLRPLRSHLLGLWRVGQADADQSAR
jgi:SAM-dependent methyltransferase